MWVVLVVPEESAFTSTDQHSYNLAVVCFESGYGKVYVSESVSMNSCNKLTLVLLVVVVSVMAATDGFMYRLLCESMLRECLELLMGCLYV